MDTKDFEIKVKEPQPPRFGLFYYYNLIGGYLKIIGLVGGLVFSFNYWVHLSFFASAVILGTLVGLIIIDDKDRRKIATKRYQIQLEQQELLKGMSKDFGEILKKQFGKKE